ncbi:tyrosine-type recombinase/integrase [Haloarchaeobius amylolyticus]|uniref:Tyrosine-type recombinase/integrase n=1 Tax=Haloarchaeobius amylolyticus TaxID=1198296 RepID=A0ABD6BLB1_9EURY
MRLESHDNKPNEYKCYLTPAEYELFIEVTDTRAAEYQERTKLSLRDEVMVRLGGDVGLRSREIVSVKANDLKVDEYGDRYIKVKGKNTRGGAPKTREAYVPDGCFSAIRDWMATRGVKPDEDTRILPITTRALRDRIEVLRERAAEQADNDDWNHVTSHDLRRFYAQDLLVRKGVGVRVVMAWGGWSSYSAIEPYLTSPTPEQMHEEIARHEL